MVYFSSAIHPTLKESGLSAQILCNNIVIQSKGINIVIGHIQRHSIKVKVKDFVNEGQHIANIGNSGLTEFLHLHIQAMKVVEGSIWSGEGIPILFDGKFLVKNTLITKI
ncbi:peptidoglycan DD-metalloendopeptidase family protein [Clostridium tagluense]|uniref:peptidoglycan DD-metalloendopeptidase family protein n=1 Tax=Clostridium tagluense TaxID=360422 RepID=UPI001CF5673F|nr:peptidoglycan DD-metalloendopeptidase family protein [Clostridium tagluense]MCB2299317.1 M23 family metallopeptidase [Clostridium tagluense]